MPKRGLRHEPIERGAAYERNVDLMGFVCVCQYIVASLDASSLSVMWLHDDGV